MDIRGVSTSQKRTHRGRRTTDAIIAREAGIVDLKLKKLRTSLQAFLDGIRENNFAQAYNETMRTGLFEEYKKLNQGEIAAFKNAILKYFRAFADTGKVSKVIQDAVEYLNYPDDPYSRNGITGILHGKIRDYLNRGKFDAAVSIWLVCPRDADRRLSKINLEKLTEAAK